MQHTHYSLKFEFKFNYLIDFTFRIELINLNFTWQSLSMQDTKRIKMFFRGYKCQSFLLHRAINNWWIIFDEQCWPTMLAAQHSLCLKTKSFSISFRRKGGAVGSSRFFYEFNENFNVYNAWNAINEIKIYISWEKTQIFYLPSDIAVFDIRNLVQTICSWIH